jgi:hypothetical protein
VLVYILPFLTTLCRVTQREGEVKQTWRAMDQEVYKKGPFSNWGFEGEGLVKGAKTLTKVRKLITQLTAILGADRMVISSAFTTGQNCNHGIRTGSCSSEMRLIPQVP